VARIGPATNKLAGSLKAARFAAFLLGDGTQLWASRGWRSRDRYAGSGRGAVRRDRGSLPWWGASTDTLL